MIGVNELHLNAATLMAAVQEYLNKRHMPGYAPKVASMRFMGDNYVFRTDGVLTTPSSTQVALEKLSAEQREKVRQ